MDDLSLIMKLDEEGPESEEEAAEMARACIRTGLVYSTGRYGRFVRDVRAAGLLEEENDVRTSQER